MARTTSTDEGIEHCLNQGGTSQKTVVRKENMAETDQENIDALLDEVGENAPAENQSSTEDDSTAASGEETDDMDALLAEMQTNPSLDQSESEVNINDLLTEIQSGASPDDSTATQSDIDALMQTVGGKMEDMPAEEEEGVNIDFLLDMKLTITFEVGRSKLLIGDLLSLGQGSVIELHRLVGEDLDMFVNGRLIAKGEVVVVNEKFGVRILDIVSPEDRIKNMAGFDKLT